MEYIPFCGFLRWNSCHVSASRPHMEQLYANYTFINKPIHIFHRPIPLLGIFSERDFVAWQLVHFGEAHPCCNKVTTTISRPVECLRNNKKEISTSTVTAAVAVARNDTKWCART